jgi:hypothetical protein
MWLPKDERRILAGYYQLLGEVNHERVYRIDDLLPLLESQPNIKAMTEYGQPRLHSISSPDLDDLQQLKLNTRQHIAKKIRFDRANRLLHARKMISLKSHENEMEVILVGLTIRGFDLARRYHSWFESSGLWFQAHRNHWIWLAFSFAGGIAASLLSNWLLIRR